MRPHPPRVVRTERRFPGGGLVVHAVHSSLFEVHGKQLGFPRDPEIAPFETVGADLFGARLKPESGVHLKEATLDARLFALVARERSLAVQRVLVPVARVVEVTLDARLLVLKEALPDARVAAVQRHGGPWA